MSEIVPLNGHVRIRCWEKQADGSEVLVKDSTLKNPLLRLWTGKLPSNELDDLILATGIKLEPNGYLNEESRKIASHVKISHEAINTIEDEEDIRAQLIQSNAMYAYAELPLCNCRKCRAIWTKTARKESGPPLATTNLHPS